MGRIFAALVLYSIWITTLTYGIWAFCNDKDIIHSAIPFLIGVVMTGLTTLLLLLAKLEKLPRIRSKKGS